MKDVRGHPLSTYEKPYNGNFEKTWNNSYIHALLNSFDMLYLQFRGALEYIKIPKMYLGMRVLAYVLNV